MKIVRGVQRSPLRVVLYGVEGIGKSTLASQFPDAVILDTEDGTGQIDCARVVCHDFVTLEGAMNDLARDSQGFRTVVVDSADWAERHIVEHMLKKAGKKSIEDFGFGKGYVMLSEQITRLLTLADQLVARGMHVVFVAHAKVQRTSPPDETDGYDRWELKLTKHSAPLLKEWADLVMFANYRTTLIEGSDGRMKARGGKERLIYTERCAAWDAKNRFGLPPELPMAIGGLSHLWSQSAAKPVAVEAPLYERIAEYIAKAATVRTLGTIGDKVDGYVSTGELSDDEAEQLRTLIGERHNALEPQEVAQ